MSDAVPSRFLDPKSPPHIATLILMTGAAALAMNVFLPALPEMAAYFEVDYRFIQLSVAIYLAMNAGLQMILGPVSDQYGRRPVLLASFAVFLIATLGCIFAPNVWVFLVFRMTQAFVVTGLVLSRAVIRDVVGGPKAASMIAYVTMGMSLVPMFAPAIGGFLAQQFGWQSTFWLQFGAGLLVLILMYRDLGETKPRGEGGFRAQFGSYPKLFASPRFWGYALSAMLASGAFFAYLGGAPFVGSEIFGLDSGLLGFLFGAPAVGYLIGNFLTGRYAVHFGINPLILMGNIATALGLCLLLLMMAAGSVTPILFFAMMTFVGLGNGLVLPNANAGLLSVRPELAGSASGLGGALMIGGGAGISAIVGAMLTIETGPLPLVLMMLLCTTLALICILFVIARERRLQLTR
ncbi:multidrug effflux MFS transporter [Maritimibacter sp. DP4N28-5]|uniref:Bcr/CflA family efflux transporter n=2 Tax=Maritimibacter dapengensis TaxID=2836868 RepID=A0ABS6T052_9RHOB|nr:multidrug effflux MFS transporter [Maritimibacter dapengensis]